MEIKRDIYSDRLIRREKNGLIKIVTGVRRCGKSYLLLNLFYNYLPDKGVKEDHIIEIAPDDRGSKELRDPGNMLDYVKEPSCRRSCCVECRRSAAERVRKERFARRDSEELRRTLS